METKGIYEFMAFVKQNKAAQQALEALEGRAYTDFCAAFVQVGATHGYTFSADEVEEVLDDVMAEKALTSGELTDEQLESVAGGSKALGEAALVGIGIIGDIVDNTTD